MVHIFFKYVFFIFLLLFSVITQAQQPYSITLNSLNGLPSNAVYNLHQDENGFIWLATDEGLFKYDGFQYISYKSAKQTSVAGSNIQEDEYGRIWYQNFDGFIYYVEKDSLHQLAQNEPVGFISYGITKQYLFVVQKKGIDVFSMESLSLLKTIPLSIIEAEHSTVLNKNFYLISDDIIYKIDHNLNVTSTAFFENKQFHVKYIFPYKEKLYVVSKHNESKTLYFFNEQLEYLESIPIPQLSHIQGSDVLDGVIWLHSPDGLYRYNEQGKQMDTKAMFPLSSSSKVIKDYQKNYWFASVNNGIHIVPELKDKIYNIHPFYIRTFIKTRENYLFGTQAGELLFTDHQFENKKIRYAIPQNLQTYYIYQDSIDRNLIFSNNGFTIISGNLSYKKNHNVALKEVIRLDDKYYAFAASGFFGLLINPNANKASYSIWDNLFYKNQDKDIPEVARLKSGFRAKSVGFFQKEQKIFFATSIGVFAITPNGEEELKYNKEPIYADKIICSENRIFFLDTKGNLFQFDGDKTLVSLSKKWNLPKERVQILKKFGNDILLLCDNHIYLMNDKGPEKVDILIKNNSIRDFWYEEGSLTVLTDEGVLLLPLSINRTKKNVLFHVNQLWVNNSPISWSNFHRLDYESNNIRIDFSVLEFIKKNIAIYYRMNKGAWVLINNETRTLQFPSLASGKYLIEFKIGEEVSDKKINFEIVLPFWKRGWFYLIFSLILVSLVSLYFRWRSRLMQKQITLLNEKVALEKSLGKSILSSIKSQMNPHFFYNALNTIQAYIFTNDKAKASNYLSKFSKLTRIVLEMSEKENVTLHEEMDAIKLYLDLEKMRFSDSFTYEIVLKNDLDPDMLEFPPMLLQPYIENSIKHGLLHKKGDKKVSIFFEKKGELLLVSIEDNGIGRKRSIELNTIKNNKHKPFSTAANEKRLEILNKGRKEKIFVKIIDQFDDTGSPCGTTVLLAIPTK